MAHSWLIVAHFLRFRSQFRSVLAHPFAHRLAHLLVAAHLDLLEVHERLSCGLLLLFFFGSFVSHLLVAAAAAAAAHLDLLEVHERLVLD